MSSDFMEEDSEIIMEMPSRDISPPTPRHRHSITIEPEGNPLVGNKSKHFVPITNLKVENLSDTRLIEPSELDGLIARLKALDSNEKRLTLLDVEKRSYLFRSVDLIKLMEVTPSVKTRIAMISQISPRLIDPKAKSDVLVGMFRYSEEKSQVVDALKARSKALENSRYNVQSQSPVVSSSSGHNSPVPLTVAASGRASGRGRGGRSGARGGGGVSHSNPGRTNKNTGDSDHSSSYDSPVSTPTPTINIAKSDNRSNIKNNEHDNNHDRMIMITDDDDMNLIHPLPVPGSPVPVSVPVTPSSETCDFDPPFRPTVIVTSTVTSSGSCGAFTTDQYPPLQTDTVASLSNRIEGDGGGDGDRLDSEGVGGSELGSELGSESETSPHRGAPLHLSFSTPKTIIKDDNDNVDNDTTNTTQDAKSATERDHLSLSSSLSLGLGVVVNDNDKENKEEEKRHHHFVQSNGKEMTSNNEDLLLRNKNIVINTNHIDHTTTTTTTTATTTPTSTAIHLPSEYKESAPPAALSLPRYLVPQQLIDSGIIPLHVLCQPETWVLKAEREAWSDIFEEDDNDTHSMWSEADDRLALPIYKCDVTVAVTGGAGGGVRGQGQGQKHPLPSMMVRENSKPLNGVGSGVQGAASKEKDAPTGWFRQRLSSLSLAAKCKHFVKGITKSSASSQSKAKGMETEAKSVSSSTLAAKNEEELVRKLCKGIVTEVCLETAIAVATEAITAMENLTAPTNTIPVPVDNELKSSAQTQGQGQGQGSSAGTPGALSLSTQSPSPQSAMSMSESESSNVTVTHPMSSMMMSPVFDSSSSSSSPLTSSMPSETLMSGSILGGHTEERVKQTQTLKQKQSVPVPVPVPGILPTPVPAPPITPIAPLSLSLQFDSPSLSLSPSPTSSPSLSSSSLNNASATASGTLVSSSRKEVSNYYSLDDVPGVPSSTSRRSSVSGARDSSLSPRRRSINAVHDAKIVGSRVEEIKKMLSLKAVPLKGNANTINNSNSNGNISNIPMNPSMTLPANFSIHRSSSVQHMYTTPERQGSGLLATQRPSLTETSSDRGGTGTGTGTAQVYTSGSTSPNSSSTATAAAAELSSATASGFMEAAVLGMDLKSFLQLEPDDPVGRSPEGLLLLSYAELVRRNFTKEFHGLQRTELQEHLTDDSFLELFGMTKEIFRALPQWRRNDKKRALMLF